MTGVNRLWPSLLVVVELLMVSSTILVSRVEITIDMSPITYLPT